MNPIERIERQYTKKEFPPFGVGDRVKVILKVIEGDKQRLQVFEGDVIARRGRNTNETITVRKISYGVGVERVFPLQSPFIENIQVVRKGRVRRARLYYLREKKGKATKIKEKTSQNQKSRNAGKNKKP